MFLCISCGNMDLSVCLSQTNLPEFPGTHARSPRFSCSHELLQMPHDERSSLGLKVTSTDAAG
ncbi:hypothetical protein BC937DRAFT_87772, partial [Endogone sp. FLAS-F59071]